MALNVGDVAPDFELPAVTGEEKSKIKLSDYRGKKNVVLGQNHRELIHHNS